MLSSHALRVCLRDLQDTPLYSCACLLVSCVVGVCGCASALLALRHPHGRCRTCMDFTWHCSIFGAVLPIRWCILLVWHGRASPAFMGCIITSPGHLAVRSCRCMRLCHFVFRVLGRLLVLYLCHPLYFVFALHVFALPLPAFFLDCLRWLACMIPTCTLPLLQLIRGVWLTWPLVCTA